MVVGSRTNIPNNISSSFSSLLGLLTTSPKPTKLLGTTVAAFLSTGFWLICVYKLYQQRLLILQLAEAIHHNNQENRLPKEKKQEESVCVRRSDSTTIVPIGTIRTVFKLCVGTPRQGLLAPNSRGIISIDSTVLAPDCILGLEEFSHLWIVFHFHLNTNTQTVLTSSHKKHMFPSKVSPPALGGKKKVGIFTTRTPHRLNPIGFSLCKIDKVDIPNNRLYVSGIDLVDGTPIFDLKPFVPHYDSAENVQLPDWVSTGLDQRRMVRFTPESEEELKHLVHTRQLQFYNTNNEDKEELEYDNIKNCIEQILAVDVRSVRQTRNARQGKFQAERALKHVNRPTGPNNKPSPLESSHPQLCTQQIDNLLIHYSVSSPSNNTADSQTPDSSTKTTNDKKSFHISDVAEGSGCNDIIQVIHIEMFRQQNSHLSEDRDTEDTPKRNTLEEYSIDETHIIKQVSSDGKLSVMAGGDIILKHIEPSPEKKKNSSSPQLTSTTREKREVSLSWDSEESDSKSSSW